jgi:hypothetical protein
MRAKAIIAGTATTIISQSIFPNENRTESPSIQAIVRTTETSRVRKAANTIQQIASPSGVTGTKA